jgi:alanine racemase
VLQWKTRVISLKNIKRGDTVGYNRTYKATKKERIAIIPVGYADGYPRALSNQGEVLILGKKAVVRGIVSMDMIAIDCTNISGVREGTEVTIIGDDSRLSINAWELADKAGTIAYEILCGISPRVPRIYYD